MMCVYNEMRSFPPSFPLLTLPDVFQDKYQKHSFSYHGNTCLFIFIPAYIKELGNGMNLGVSQQMNG